MTTSDREVARAFGAVLRTARHGVGLTQEALANEAGIDHSYPSLLERGLRSPTLPMVIRLATGLKLEPTLLVQMTLRRLEASRG